MLIVSPKDKQAYSLLDETRSQSENEVTETRKGIQNMEGKTAAMEHQKVVYKLSPLGLPLRPSLFTLNSRLITRFLPRFPVISMIFFLSSCVGGLRFWKSNGNFKTLPCEPGIRLHQTRFGLFLMQRNLCPWKTKPHNPRFSPGETTEALMASQEMWNPQKLKVRHESIEENVL